MWNAVVGGVVGAIFGGPIGAAAGAAMGAGLDALNENETTGLPQLPAELHFEDDEDGRIFQVSGMDVPNGTMIGISARTDTGAFQQCDFTAMRDGDGDFALMTEATDGDARFYIPFGLVKPSADGNLYLAIRAVSVAGGDVQVIGETIFHFPWQNQSFVMVRFWRPLVGICMTVARADGTLDRSEVASIREIVEEGLGVPAHERNECKDILRSEPSAPLADLVSKIMVRAPWVEPMHLIECMVQVAHADGVIHPKEVAAIKEVAEMFGVDESGWAELITNYALDGPQLLADYWQLLELSEGATKREVQLAWRRKVAQYHPDKYQGLPEEFRKVAHDMTTRLNVAKDALLQVAT